MIIITKNDGSTVRTIAQANHDGIDEKAMIFLVPVYAANAYAECGSGATYDMTEVTEDVGWLIETYGEKNTDYGVWSLELAPLKAEGNEVSFTAKFCRCGSVLLAVPCEYEFGKAVDEIRSTCGIDGIEKKISVKGVFEKDGVSLSDVAKDWFVSLNVKGDVTGGAVVEDHKIAVTDCNTFCSFAIKSDNMFDELTPSMYETSDGEIVTQDEDWLTIKDHVIGIRLKTTEDYFAFCQRTLSVTAGDSYAFSGKFDTLNAKYLLQFLDQSYLPMENITRFYGFPYNPVAKAFEIDEFATFTIPQNAAYVKIGFIAKSGEGTVHHYISNFQVEHAQTASEYQPFLEFTASASPKIGTTSKTFCGLSDGGVKFCNELQLEKDGTGVFTERVKKYTLSKKLYPDAVAPSSWQTLEDSTTFSLAVSTKPEERVREGATQLSDCFIKGSEHWADDTGSERFLFVTDDDGKTTLFVAIKDSKTSITSSMTDAEKLAAVKNYLTSNNAVFYYITAHKIVKAITPINMANFQRELPRKVNISVSNVLKPDVKLVYNRDLDAFASTVEKEIKELQD